MTQQVSHRPIKRQSRLWSQRGTKVNGSHHGDNPLLRPTGIQIATKSYAALQAMAPTNIKTVHQTSLLHSRATSIDSECCRLPTTSVLSKKLSLRRTNARTTLCPLRPYIMGSELRCQNFNLVKFREIIPRNPCYRTFFSQNLGSEFSKNSHPPAEPKLESEVWPNSDPSSGLDNLVRTPPRGISPYMYGSRLK